MTDRVADLLRQIFELDDVEFLEFGAALARAKSLSTRSRRARRPSGRLMSQTFVRLPSKMRSPDSLQARVLDEVGPRFSRADLWRAFEKHGSAGYVSIARAVSASVAEWKKRKLIAAVGEKE